MLREKIGQLVRHMTRLNENPTLYIRAGAEGYDIVLHCAADPDLPVVEAHRLADRIERQIALSLPEIHQVLVHLEPDE